MEDARPSWDEIYIDMARLVARRSTCPRLACGAVIVSSEHQVLATGYNGSPRGEPHCSDVGCLMESGHCVRSVHAEMNAILQCARLGISLKGSTLYCTHRTCIRCATAIAQAGIIEVVYQHSYDTDNLTDFVTTRLESAGIRQRWLEDGSV